MYMRAHTHQRQLKLYVLVVTNFKVNKRTMNTYCEVLRNYKQWYREGKNQRKNVNIISRS